MGLSESPHQIEDKVIGQLDCIFELTNRLQPLGVDQLHQQRNQVGGFEAGRRDVRRAGRHSVDKRVQVRLRNRADGNEIIAESAAKLALARKCRLNILFGDQAGTNQKIAQTHAVSDGTLPASAHRFSYPSYRTSARIFQFIRRILPRSNKNGRRLIVARNPG
jgi:hypothetical protein